MRSGSGQRDDSIGDGIGFGSIVGDPDGRDAASSAGPVATSSRGGRGARGRGRSAARRGAAPWAPGRASGRGRHVWPLRPTDRSPADARTRRGRRGRAARPRAGRVAGAAMPPIFNPKPMFDATSRCGKSCSSWNTIPTRRRWVGQVRDVGAVDGDGPTVGHDEPGDHPQQRALAASRGAEQGDDLTARRPTSTRRRALSCRRT